MKFKAISNKGYILLTELVVPHYLLSSILDNIEFFP